MEVHTIRAPRAWKAAAARPHSKALRAHTGLENLKMFSSRPSCETLQRLSFNRLVRERNRCGSVLICGLLFLLDEPRACSVPGLSVRECVPRLIQWQPLQRQRET